MKHLEIKAYCEPNIYIKNNKDKVIAVNIV